MDITYEEKDIINAVQRNIGIGDTFRISSFDKRCEKDIYERKVEAFYPHCVLAKTIDDYREAYTYYDIYRFLFRTDLELYSQDQ